MTARIVALCETETGAMTVNLTRIYTKLGDGGETHLGDRSRVRKDDPRIEAYGDGRRARRAPRRRADAARTCRRATAEWLRRIQNDLFDVGADLAVRQEDARERLRLLPAQVEWLEARCDEVNATLEPLRSFVLAGANAGVRVTARLPDRLPARRAPRRRARRTTRARRSCATSTG